MSNDGYVSLADRLEAAVTRAEKAERERDGARQLLTNAERSCMGSPAPDCGEVADRVREALRFWGLG